MYEACWTRGCRFCRRRMYTLRTFPLPLSSSSFFFFLSLRRCTHSVYPASTSDPDILAISVAPHTHSPFLLVVSFIVQLYFSLSLTQTFTPNISFSILCVIHAGPVSLGSFILFRSPIMGLTHAPHCPQQRASSSKSYDK